MVTKSLARHLLSGLYPAFAGVMVTLLYKSSVNATNGERMSIKNQAAWVVATVTLLMAMVGLTAKAANLPSSSYDDYDREKYESQFGQATNDLNVSRSNLDTAQTLLANAVARENALRQNYDETSRRYEGARRRDMELDRDIRQNRDRQNQLQQIINANTQKDSDLQRQVQDAQGSVDRNKTTVDGLQADYNAQAAQLSSLQSTLNAKQSAYNKAESDLNAQNTKIENLKRQLDAAPADQKPAIQANLNQALADLPNYMTAKSNASSELQTAKSAYDSKNSSVQALKSRLDTARAELNAANSRLSQTQQALNQNRNELNNARNQYDDSRRREQDLMRASIENRRYLQDLQNQLSDLDGRIRQASAETAQRTSDRDQYQQIYNVQLNRYNNAQARLAQVNQYIEQARQVITSDASSDGNSDGGREGQEIGTADGIRNGTAKGQVDGENEGTSDGQDREYATGQGLGLADAEKEASNPKSISVTTDGSAYRVGLAKGEQFGLATGSNKASYNTGRKAGEAQGLANAKQDAIPQVQMGYDQREQQYLNAPLKKATIGETQTLSKNFDGVQGRYSNSGDDRYYNPRPENYPHPRLTRFYQDAYAGSYRNSVDSQYSSSYGAAYSASYTSSHQKAYDAAYARTYPASQDLGYKQAYRGFTDGNAIGSQKKGYAEGLDFAYRANIDREKKEAFDRGVAKADDLYTKNAVTRVVSLTLVDNDRDGIYRPGETVQVVTVIKNFGLVAKTDLVMDAAALSNTSAVVEARATVPQVDPQSETTIIGRQQIQIRSSTAEGSSLDVKYSLSDSKTEMARQPFKALVQYPTTLKFVGFDGVLIPGQATDVKVAVTNRSKSVQNVTVTLAIDASKVDAASNSIDVNQLAAGETRQVAFNLTGKMDARFQETDMKFTVQQNKLLFGGMDSSLTIIKRHTVNPNGLGLIISSNLARGSGKYVYDLGTAIGASSSAADKNVIDTWDLRVDGSIASADQLKDYAKKVVFMMTDAGASIDGATAASVTKFVTDGGQLVLIGAEMDQAPVMQQLASIAQALVDTRSGSIMGSMKGSSYLAGLSINPTQGLLVKVGGKRSREVLTSSTGINGVASFVNAYASQVGHVYTIGIDPQSMKADDLKKMIDTIQYTAKPYEDKLQDAKNGNVNMVYSILIDIYDEVMLAMINNGSDYYHQNKDNTKSAKAVAVLIGETSRGSDVRRALSTGYPVLKGMISQWGTNMESFSLDQILQSRPGMWYPNIKELYCTGDHSQESICR